MNVEDETSNFDIARIDEVIHGRVRLGIMAYLSGVESADFGELKTIIGGPGASERFAARMGAELHAQKIK